MKRLKRLFGRAPTERDHLLATGKTKGRMVEKNPNKQDAPHHRPTLSSGSVADRRAAMQARRPRKGRPGLTRQNAFRLERRHYDWREFFRGGGGGLCAFFRWLLNGYTPAGEAKLSDEEFMFNLECLARMLMLLREYLDRYGMPTEGSPKDQEYVLREGTLLLFAVEAAAKGWCRYILCVREFHKLWHRVFRRVMTGRYFP